MSLVKDVCLIIFKSHFMEYRFYSRLVFQQQIYGRQKTTCL